MFQKTVKTVHENTPICQFISKAACSKLQPYLSQFNYSLQTEQRHITMSLYIHTRNTEVCRRMVLILPPHWVADNHMSSHELIPWSHGMSCTEVRAVTSGPHINKRSLYFPMLHGRCWVVTPAPLGTATPSYCEEEEVHSIAIQLLAPSTAPTPQSSCKEQAIHKTAVDGEFTIWKEAAAIMCGSMSHYTTKSLFSYFLFKCVKSKCEVLLLY